MSKFNKKGFGLQFIMTAVSRVISISRTVIKFRMTGLGQEGDSVKQLETVNSVFWRVFCPQSGNFSSMISSFIGKNYTNPNMIGSIFKRLSLLVGVGFTSVYLLLCLVIGWWTQDVYALFYSIGISPLIYSMFVSSFCTALLNVHGKFVAAAGGTMFGNISALSLLAIGYCVYSGTEYAILLTGMHVVCVFVMNFYTFMQTNRWIALGAFVLQIASICAKFYLYDYVFYFLQIASAVMQVFVFQSVQDKVVAGLGTLLMVFGNFYGIWGILLSFVWVSRSNIEYNSFKALLCVMGVLSILLFGNASINIQTIVYISLFMSHVSYTILQSINLITQSLPFISFRGHADNNMVSECNAVVKDVAVLVCIQSPKRIVDVFCQTLSRVIYPGFVAQVNVMHMAICGSLQIISLPIKSMIQNMLSTKKDGEFASHAFKLLTLAHLLALSSFLILSNPSVVMVVVNVVASKQQETASVLALFPIIHMGIYFETIAGLGQQILSIQKKMKNLAKASLFTVILHVSIVSIAFLIHKQWLPGFIVEYLPQNYNVYGAALLKFMYFVLYACEFGFVFTQLIRTKSISLKKTDLTFIALSVFIVLQFMFFPIGGVIQYIISVPLYIGIIVRYIFYVI